MSNNCLANLIANPRLVDTHCHLHSEQFSNPSVLQMALRNAIKAGVEEIWLMSVDANSFERNLEILQFARQRFPELKLRLSLGFDMEILVPGSDLFDLSWFNLSEEQLSIKVQNHLVQLTSLAVSKGYKVDLIGEIGMDFYWLNEHLKRQLAATNEQASGDSLVNLTSQEVRHSKLLQKAMFLTQLDFAVVQGLPVSMHTRGAESECINIVRDYRNRDRKFTGIFHSSTGNGAQFNEIKQLGWHIGINGIVTFKSATDIQNSVRRRLPTELNLESFYQAGFVLETDSPYLIPSNANRKQIEADFRQSINEPAQVANTWQWLQSSVV